LLRAVLLERYEAPYGAGGYGRPIYSSRVLSGTKGRDQYIIRIPRGRLCARVHWDPRELTKVQDLIKAHMPSMMHYRIGL